MKSKLKACFIIALIGLGSVAIVPIFSSSALARDNRTEVRRNAQNGGWQLISVKHLDHWAYARHGPMLTNPAAYYSFVFDAYSRLYDVWEDANLARTAIQMLANSMKGGSSQSVSVQGYDIKSLLLTYQHWHYEKVPTGRVDCDFQGVETECIPESRWIRVSEPNTHELFIAIRPKRPISHRTSNKSKATVCNGRQEILSIALALRIGSGPNDRKGE